MGSIGRPLKIVDPLDVIEHASKGLSAKEIAAHCDISEATLYRRFKKAIDKGHQLCNSSLRKRQYERAMAGSDTMLIWLGKNLLEQSDITRSETEIKGNVSVHVVFDIAQQRPQPRLNSENA